MPEQVSGRILLVKTVNRKDFENRLGSVSREDGKNLNREFPGDPMGTVTERLAAAVVKHLHKEADYYIDLHSGDDYEELAPYIYYAGKADPEVTRISREMARQADVPYMVRSEVDSGGSYNYAASRGIPSVLLERGRHGSLERRGGSGPPKRMCGASWIIWESAPGAISSEPTIPWK